jgi:hypothetical protein
LQERLASLIETRDRLASQQPEPPPPHHLLEIHTLLLNSEIDDETKLRVVREALQENAKISNFLFCKDVDEATKIEVLGEDIVEKAEKFRVLGEAIADKRLYQRLEWLMRQCDRLSIKPEQEAIARRNRHAEDVKERIAEMLNAGYALCVRVGSKGETVALTTSLEKVLAGIQTRNGSMNLVAGYEKGSDEPAFVASIIYFSNSISYHLKWCEDDSLAR